ncbi:hypothetical protein F5B19DRAFT_480197 [Rostrohypoxylon terebratum]|nr:hypothetical protein F5B19DRAFT_480197 [Rostrohypoxylon terebratum]
MFAVLKGKASSYVGAILKRERHAIPRFCRSKKAIDDIIKDLEAHNPQCENEPLRWIGMMLEWEVEDRPQATELRDYILKDGYCGICCYHNYMFEGIPTH